MTSPRILRRRWSPAAWTALLCLALAGTAGAAEVTVAWDPNPPDENVTGYLVYYGTTSRSVPAFQSYGVELDVGGVTQHTVSLPDDGATYYLALRAYNQAGLRSDYSQELVAEPADAGSFLLTASAGAGGTISPAGALAVAAGGAQTFAVTPDPGYEVADVVVDGASVGPVGSYTFTGVAADHSIEAGFAAVSADSDGNGMADAWELQHFGGLGVSAAADADGDGIANGQEYANGTDPTVPDLDPALTPAVRAPVSGGTVVSLRPELSVYNAVAASEAKPTYEFVLARDPGLAERAATAKGVLQNVGVTSWTPGTPLSDRTRYYWRARAVTGTASSPWTPVCTFVVDAQGRETWSDVEATQYVVANGGAVLDVRDPALATYGVAVDMGFVRLPYDLVLTVGPVENPPPATGDVRLAGRVVEFGPHGLEFDHPVKLLLPYRDEDLVRLGLEDPGELGVFTYDTATLQWQPVPVAGIDYRGRRVLFEVGHFSLYALGARSSGSPGGAPNVPAPAATPETASSGGGGGGGCFLRSLGF